MNKELFLSATIENVSRSYSGQRDCCRCGCRGVYTDTTYNTSPNVYTDVNNKLVETRLRRAKKMVESGANVEYFLNGVDIESGNNRSLTFYFDYVKSVIK